MAAFDYIIVIYSEDGIKNITPYLPMWLNINLTTLEGKETMLAVLWVN